MEKITHESKTWLNVIHPTEKDVETLKRLYLFHELDLEDCLAESQRPKIDEYEKYLFIVLHFPYYSRSTGRIRAEQLNLFIGQDYVVTLSSGKLEPLNDLFRRCKRSLKLKRAFLSNSTGYLLYEIVSHLASTFYPITDQISLKLKNIENDIFEGQEVKDQLLEIMLVKKNVITLRTMILPQRTVIASLEHKHRKFLPESLTIYFDDIVDKIEKTWNILDAQKEVIESLEDTHESILSHRINNTMKILTVFSAIMLPLTFLTGLFGMNVKLPFSEALEISRHFWTSIGIMVGVSVAMFGIFKWKRWL